MATVFLNGEELTVLPPEIDVTLEGEHPFKVNKILDCSFSFTIPPSSMAIKFYREVSRIVRLQRVKKIIRKRAQQKREEVMPGKWTRFLPDGRSVVIRNGNLSMEDVCEYCDFDLICNHGCAADHGELRALCFERELGYLRLTKSKVQE